MLVHHDTPKRIPEFHGNSRYRGGTATALNETERCRISRGREVRTGPREFEVLEAFRTTHHREFSALPGGSGKMEFVCIRRETACVTAAMADDRNFQPLMLFMNIGGIVDSAADRAEFLIIF